ncbi:MAG TPA: hypothetical protein VFE30_05840 [Anaeromyxobacteraceae bacterium]|jgi:hypothetical protein|nr:hypothetical protein [Anaeromyxobacteraceae bacterium]
MAARFLIAALVLSTITGCAHYRKELDDHPPFSEHSFRYHDVEVHWRAQDLGETLRISGTISNLRSFFLQDLELTARLVDSRGKVFARGTASDFPSYVSPSTTEPFELAISTPVGTKTERIRFSYFYWLAEGAPELRGHADVPHFGSFDSPP